jgi:hypothetical protein
MKCVPAKIEGSATVKTTVTVPAAWTTPRS